MTEEVLWMIHLRDGRTIKNENIWDVPEDEITSIERVVDGKLYTIRKSPALTNFFVKTTSGQELRMLPGKNIVSPPVIVERIVGAYVKPSDKPVRIELAIDPKTGNVKLSCFPVKEITKDGF